MFVPPLDHTKFFQSCLCWLFQGISIVLPATVPCAGLLTQSLACLGQSQRLDSCSDLTSPLQQMPVNALTPATEKLTKLLFGRELIARGHCISWKCQSPCTRMQELWRGGCSQHNVSFLRTVQGHTSRTGTVLRDLPRPVRAAFLDKGTECCRTLIWSSCQSSSRNTAVLIWQKTLQQPDHTACCVSGHSHSANPGTLWGKNKNIYQYYQNHSGTSASPRFLRGVGPWPILEILFCTL